MSSDLFHAHLRRLGLFGRSTTLLNLSEDELRAQVIRPWRAGESVTAQGQHWRPTETKLTIYTGPRVTTNQQALGQGWLNATRNGEDVTDAMLEGNAGIDDRYGETPTRHTLGQAFRLTIKSGLQWPAMIGFFVALLNSLEQDLWKTVVFAALLALATFGPPVGIWAATRWPGGRVLAIELKTPGGVRALAAVTGLLVGLCLVWGGVGAGVLALIAVYVAYVAGRQSTQGDQEQNAQATPEHGITFDQQGETESDQQN